MALACKETTVHLKVQSLSQSQESTTNFYIFTVPSSPNQGLRYSEVDMSQSGGLGAVLTTNKNTLLLNPFSR